MTANANDRQHTTVLDFPQLPLTLELCARIRDACPCLAPIYRPGGARPYCFRCGATDGAVVRYQRVADPEEARHE